MNTRTLMSGGVYLIFCMDMNRKYTLILAASTAIMGGLVAAVLVWPDSVRNVRRAASGQARARTKWAGSRLSDVRDQLSRIETQLQSTSAEFAQRITEVGRGAAEKYLPDDPLRREEWDLDRRDIAQDLPRMPRR